MKKLMAGLFVVLISAAFLQMGCNPKASPAATGSPVLNSSLTFSTFYTGAVNPRGLSADSQGNVYYSADTNPGFVLKIAPGGAATTVASGLYYPRSLAVDQTGAIYVDSGPRPRRLFKVAGGTKIVLTAIHRILGIAVNNGNLIVGSERTGIIYSVSGSGNSVSNFATGFSQAHGVAVGQDGTAYVTDVNNGTVSKIVGGVKSTFASSLNRPWGVAVDNKGNVFVTEKGNGRLDMFTPLGVKTVLNTYSQPRGVALDGIGGLYVADSGTGNIEKVQFPVWP